MSYLEIAKRVSLSRKTDPGPHRRGIVVHDELADLYLSAASELNSTWRPEIGPFIYSCRPELRERAESACKEFDRVWRVVVDGKLGVSDFQHALGTWRDLYLEQIKAYQQEGHTWDPSPRVWVFKRTPEGILGRRADGSKTIYWARGEGP